MTRTFIVNLLSGIFPLAVVSLRYWNFDLDPLAFVWIVVQIACWGCALVLLRWNRDLLGLAVIAFMQSAVYWAFALGMIESANFANLMLNLLCEFVLAGVTVLLLRFNNALVNIRENQLSFRENPQQQFQLTWLFSVTLFAALASVVFLVLLKSWNQNPWSVWFSFVQVGCWVGIAESLLLPRVRWKSACCLVIGMLGFWYFVLSRERFGLVMLEIIWLPFQILVIFIPLAYRWSGWRIVPRAMAEQLLEYSNPMEKAPEPRPEIPS